MNKSMNRLVLAGMFCAFYAGVANALDVQAEIRPDPNNPGNAAIVNNTPVDGYCAEAAFRSQCTSRGIRSNSFPITLQSPGAFTVGQVIPFGIPATWRRFTVTHDSIPGETAEIEIRIAGVGTRYRMSQRAQEIIGNPSAIDFDAHAYLWTPSWATRTGQCQGIAGSSQAGAHSGTSFSAFWLTPENVTTCPRDADYTIPGLTLEKLDVHYELRAVRPEKLVSGNYHGLVNYTVGGTGSDFDMSPLNPSSSLMTFNLNLAVKQDVKVEMSADRIHLAPKGGWMEWITNGRKDEKLLGDLRFFILTSAPFKMELSCERIGVDTCLISNGSHQVPVDISVSLPSPWVDGANQPVERRLMTIGGTNLQHLKPVGLPTRQPSLLLFEVPADSVKDMHGDSSYRGTVYITFDSDI